MAAPKTPLHGFGVNDVDYPIKSTAFENGISGKRVTLWICPYYASWSYMVDRCYGNRKQFNITYSDKYVCDEWKYLTKFKAWMETQPWENKELDKDLLLQGNKVYSPETCIFVPKWVNRVLSDCYRARGECPIGVSCTKTGKYEAYISIKSIKTHLGVFDTPEEGHKAWQKAKIEQLLSAVDVLEKEDHIYYKELIKSFINRVQSISISLDNGTITEKL